MLQLKAGELLPDSKIIRAEEYQAYVSAQDMLADAREQAESIVAAAQAEFDRQKELGFEAGLEEGRMEMAMRMVDSVSETVSYFSDLEEKIVGIVMKALRKILGDMEQDERVVKQVRHALSMAKTQANVLVRVNPEDHALVQQRIDVIRKPYPGVHYLEVVSDARLPRGGCTLETGMGVIDASMELQLSAIEASLKRSFGEARA